MIRELILETVQICTQEEAMTLLIGFVVGIATIFASIGHAINVAEHAKAAARKARANAYQKRQERPVKQRRDCTDLVCLHDIPSSDTIDYGQYEVMQA